MEFSSEGQFFVTASGMATSSPFLLFVTYVLVYLEVRFLFQLGFHVVLVLGFVLGFRWSSTFASMDYEDPFTRQSSRLPDKTRFARLSSARRRLDQQRAF